MNQGRFYQDEAGEWWYDGTEKTGRTRAEERMCEVCGTPFRAIRSKPVRTCSRVCGQAWRRSHPEAVPEGRRSQYLGGARHTRYGTGKTIRRGYVLVFMPDHHSIRPETKRKYVLEHRLVMEQVLGRPLRSTERVHHLNGDTQDNRPENLELWEIGHPPGQRVEEKPHCPTCTCFKH